MMQQLGSTEFATQEGTLYPLLSKMRREDLVDYEWQRVGRRTTTQVLQAHGQGQVATGRAQPILEADQLDCGRDGAVAMNKVITINLNGNAYQLDEAGYEALRTYLDDAAARLKDNPDRAEILLDLEQAIGEKCQRYLGSHKNVVSAVEVRQIISDMGPVNGGAGNDDEARTNAKSEPQGSRARGRWGTEAPVPGARRRTDQRRL